MGVFSKIFGGKKQVEDRALSDLEQTWINSFLSMGGSDSGINVNALSAMGVSTVYACVNFLARSISALPIRLYQNINRGKRLATEHPVYDIVNLSPNSDMSAYDLKFAVQSNLALRNNAFIHVIRNRNNRRILGIEPVPIDDVEVSRDSSKNLTYKIQGKQYNPIDIIHLKNNTFNGVLGNDLMRTVQNVIGLAIALEKNAALFFKNNSKPGAILVHPGVLSDKAYERLQQSINNDTSDETRYRTRIFQEGMKYQTIRADNRDSQFDESRERQDKAIARLFGVPLRKIGINDSQPRANAEMDNLSFYQETLMPILANWESQLNLKLLSQFERRRGYYFKFNVNNILRGDIKTRHEAYRLGRQWGWYSVNDIRRFEDLDPIENGDIYLQPLNMQEANNEGDANKKNE